MEGRDWVFVTPDCCCLLCISDWAAHARRVDCALNIALVLAVYRWVYVFGRLCVLCVGGFGILAFGRWVFGILVLGVCVLGVGYWVWGVGCWGFGVWVLALGIWVSGILFLGGWASALDVRPSRPHTARTAWSGLSLSFLERVARPGWVYLSDSVFSPAGVLL